MENSWRFTVRKDKVLRGYCLPSGKYITIKELAKKLGLNDDTVATYTSRLSKKGWLERKKVAGQGRLLKYRIRDAIQTEIAMLEEKKDETQYIKKFNASW